MSLYINNMVVIISSNTQKIINNVIEQNDNEIKKKKYIDYIKYLIKREKKWHDFNLKKFNEFDKKFMSFDNDDNEYELIKKNMDLHYSNMIKSQERQNILKDLIDFYIFNKN